MRRPEALDAGFAAALPSHTGLAKVWHAYGVKKMWESLKAAVTEGRCCQEETAEASFGEEKAAASRRSPKKQRPEGRPHKSKDAALKRGAT